MPPIQDKPITEVVAKLAVAVRARLDAAGHEELTFESSWIRMEALPDGRTKAVAHVPLGRGYRLPVQIGDFEALEPDDAAVDRFAVSLARALPNVSNAARSLVHFVRSVARASWETNSADRDSGRSLHGEGVTLAPVQAAEFMTADWRTAVKRVRAILHKRGLGPDLKSESYLIEVGRPSEVAAALEPLISAQPERIRRLHLSLAPGPRLLVDAVTVDLISASGFDPVEVLRRFTRTWQFSLEVKWKGQAKTIHLNSKGQRITSSMGFDEGAHRTYWHGAGLCVEKSKRKTKAAVPGALATVLVDHPAFQGRRIIAVEPIEVEPGSCWVTLDEPVLRFDADAGTFIPDSE